MTDLEKKSEEYASEFIDELKHDIKQAYKDGYKQGQKDGYNKATERAYERQQDLTDTYIKDGKKIEELKKQIENLKTDQKDILEDNDYWQDIFSKSDKENAELKKDKEYLDKVNNEQTEIILKLDEQIEKLTKMLDMAIDDIYNETLVIHRTKEEFIDIYKSNLENKIMGETKDESISL